MRAENFGGVHSALWHFIFHSGDVKFVVLQPRAVQCSSTAYLTCTLIIFYYTSRPSVPLFPFLRTMWPSRQSSQGHAEGKAPSVNSCVKSSVWSEPVWTPSFPPAMSRPHSSHSRTVLRWPETSYKNWKWNEEGRLSNPWKARAREPTLG